MVRGKCFRETAIKVQKLLVDPRPHSIDPGNLTAERDGGDWLRVTGTSAQVNVPQKYRARIVLLARQPSVPLGEEFELEWIMWPNAEFQKQKLGIWPKDRLLLSRMR